MAELGRFASLIICGVGTAWIAAACGSSSKDGASSVAGSGNAAGVAGAAGTSTGTGMGGASGGTGSLGLGGASVVVGAGTSSGAGANNIDACAAQVTKGELVPVDMFVMLDISGSMLDPTTAGTDKWTAVKNALTAFLRDRDSSGLGVGIQYFPLNKPGVPSSCTSNAQCGTSGPCFLKLCWGALGVDALVPCEVAADCRASPLPADDFGPCVTYGTCANDESFICPEVGTQCSATGASNLGTCVGSPSVCLDAVDCRTAPYAAPAVPIGTLPAVADALVASINAQMPTGQTPTGPALSGAIEQAGAWARAHADHKVVAVLATDGLPTQCTPLEIPEIRGIASAGFNSAPSIPTFVIGVFGPEDALAPANLNAIAASGGTQQAFIVDTSQNVSDQFLSALNEIRGAQLSCEFQIPAPSAGLTLDYGLVNVDFTQGADKTRIFKVASLDACGSAGGWYYDDAALPTRIIVCPSNCEVLENSTQSSVEIQLGCKTEVR